jgi:hypothetical protein
VLGRLDSTQQVVTADYAAASSQDQRGEISASTASLLVDVDANDFIGGAINADRNLLTAQAEGLSAETSVTVAGTDLGVSGYAPVIAASNNQYQGGAVSATVSDAAVLVDVDDLNASTAGENVSIDANMILAQASGANATTSLSSAAGAGAGSIADSSTFEGGLRNNDVNAGGNRMLISDQQSEGGEDIIAVVAGAPSLELTVAAGISGDTLSVASNTVEARASDLGAINTLSNTAGTSLSAAGSLVNSQVGFADANATVNSADTIVSVGTGVASSSVDVSSNDVMAGATGSSASNTLTVAAGSINGQATPSLDAGATSASVLSVQALSSLMSVQTVASAATADVSGETEIRAQVTGSVSGSDMAVDANLVQASATAGTVTNRLTQSADTSIAAGSPAMLYSIQVATGNSAAVVEGAQVVVSATGDVSGSSVSADANTVQAMTTGLSAGNLLDVSAGTDIAGSGSTNIDATTGSVVSATDFTLVNEQEILVSTLSAQIEAAGVLAGDGAAVSVAIGGDIDTASSASVSSNMMRALVTGANAANTARVDAGSVSNAGLGLVNDQDVAAALTASIAQPSIGVTAVNVSGGSSVDISSNVIAAAATAASATNQVIVNASSTLTGGGVDTVSLSPTGTLGGFSDSAASGVATLLNGQASSGAVTSTVGGDATIGEPNITTDLSGAVTGTVAVADNVLLSQSRGNVATNVVSLTAGSTIDAASQGVLASTQDRSGAINASISGSSTGSRGTIGITSAGTVDGSLSVENNMVRASGAANTVLNSFTVNGGGSAGAPTGAALNAGTLSSNAQYAALNAQTNASSVTSSVTNFNMGLTNGAYGVTGMASLTGNTVMADATGNSAYNVMNISSGVDTYGTASMANYQSNTASMSAQVSGVSMTMDMGTAGAGGAASFRNSGNAITANAVGNTATTIMTRTR